MSSLVAEFLPEVGDGLLVVAAEVLAPAAAGHRAVDDVLARTVVVLGVLVAQRAAEVAQVDQVEVGRGDVKGG